MFDLPSMGILVPVIVAVALVLILFSGYVKASPDRAYIISGFRKKPKVLIGKAGIKIPFLEKKDELSLQLIPIDVKTSSPVPTADYININVDAAVNVKVSDKPERLSLAAQNFLNKKPEYIAQIAREVLEGNMREIVGKMNLEEMVSDRQKFASLVKENAEPDLGEMGLDIISFNVQNFMDSDGVIENLGVDNIVKIRKNAAISRAESEKEIKKAQAQAKKEANEAEVAAETAIAERENELAIKQAELKAQSDIKKAQADAAYRIQEEEQRKTIEIATSSANIAKQEQEIVLKRKEVEVKEQTLDAEVRKQAEADKFARQQNAEAELFERQRKAEADMFEKQKIAEARKIQAEADMYAKTQEAEGIRKVGEAEAAAIAAKGIAEAEATMKKAEAMSKYGQAAMAEMVINVLPEMAKAIAEPLAAIDKITIIDGGGNASNGVNSLSNNVPEIIAKSFDVYGEITGIHPSKLVASHTIDAKTTRNINITGLENVDNDELKKDVSAAVAGQVVECIREMDKDNEVPVVDEVVSETTEVE